MRAAGANLGNFQCKTKTDSLVTLQCILSCSGRLIFLFQSQQKWKQLAEMATSKCEFALAQECLHQAQDYGALLLLATSAGNSNMVKALAEGAQSGGMICNCFLEIIIASPIHLYLLQRKTMLLSYPIL